MKNASMFLASLIILLLAGQPAFGQFIPEKETPVSEVKKNASQLDKTDELVKVRGFIVKQLDKNTYLFKDGTGEVHVEIGKKHLPAIPINENTEVILIGEVDYDLLEEVEIEVEEAVQIVK
jgi:uncharacterized protein (TIGR00156 family)